MCKCANGRILLLRCYAINVQMGVERLSCTKATICTFAHSHICTFSPFYTFSHLHINKAFSHSHICTFPFHGTSPLTTLSSPKRSHLDVRQFSATSQTLVDRLLLSQHAERYVAHLWPHLFQRQRPLHRRAQQAI